MNERPGRKESRTQMNFKIKSTKNLLCEQKNGPLDFFNYQKKAAQD